MRSSTVDGFESVNFKQIKHCPLDFFPNSIILYKCRFEIHFIFKIEFWIQPRTKHIYFLLLRMPLVNNLLRNYNYIHIVFFGGHNTKIYAKGGLQDEQMNAIKCSSFSKMNGMDLLKEMFPLAPLPIWLSPW